MKFFKFLINYFTLLFKPSTALQNYTYSPDQNIKTELSVDTFNAKHSNVSTRRKRVKKSISSKKKK